MAVGTDRTSCATVDPADAVRAAAARLAAAERELAEARSALAAVEALLAASPRPLSPDALTMEQVGQALGLSRSTVAEMLRREEIRSVKIGGARRIFRADLDAYIAAARGAA